MTPEDRIRVGRDVPGRLALFDALVAKGWGQSDLARALGINQSNVSMWLFRHTRPTAAHRRALSALLNVPIETWDTAKERALVERLGAGGEGEAA